MGSIIKKVVHKSDVNICDVHEMLHQLAKKETRISGVDLTVEMVPEIDYRGFIHRTSHMNIGITMKRTAGIMQMKGRIRVNLNNPLLSVKTKKDLFHLLRSFYHEIYHTYQYKIITSDIISMKNFVYAKEAILSNLAIKYYLRNHNAFISELYADIHGINMAFRTIKRYLDPIQMQEISLEVDNLKASCLNKLNGGYHINDNKDKVDKYISEQLELERCLQMIGACNARKYRNLFPILKLEYDCNGERKNYAKIIRGIEEKQHDVVSLEGKEDLCLIRGKIVEYHKYLQEEESFIKAYY